MENNIYSNIDFSVINIIKKIQESSFWRYTGGLLFTCTGHSVNIYQINPDQKGFTETGFFSIGSFAKDQATEEEFNNGVDGYIDQLMEV